MKEIKESNIIYVLCPINLKTGGTELLHQLVSELNRKGKKAYICYDREQEDFNVCEEFKKYINEYKILTEIDDVADNLIIVPETLTIRLNKFSKLQKSVWWMSVDNYFRHQDVLFTLKHYGMKQASHLFVKKIIGREKHLTIRDLKEIPFHFVQSYYAHDYLGKLGFNTIFLSDYINEFFYGIDFRKLKKENVIAYYPLKGYKITQKIIPEYSKAKWVPIVNMTNDQVRETLMKAKLYVDFGNFPGKDRIPREAALSYCCVLTGKFGASAYYEDLPIDDKYKFSEPLKHISEIVRQIDYCISEYDVAINEFDVYRNRILQEKKIFGEEIDRIFLTD